MGQNEPQGVSTLALDLPSSTAFTLMAQAVCPTTGLYSGFSRVPSGQRHFFQELFI